MKHKQRANQADWWQSIRWRLALGSTLVALIATVLLASIILVIINISYGGNQRQELINLANDVTYRVGKAFVHSNNLYQAAQENIPGLSTQSATGEQYLQLVYGPGRTFNLIYPRTNKTQILPRALIVLAADPSLDNGDYIHIQIAINAARAGKTTEGAIGAHGADDASRPFVVEPIFANAESTNQVIGVLLVIPRSAVDNTTPPFLTNIHLAILLVSLAVVLLAALAAILFSRTITRPLAKLTGTAQVLAEGNYSARVVTGARGELGELANVFNEMAARLQQDVAELQQQELRRRELIMNVTHDLATPLTAIAGLGEALADGISQNREDFQETGRIIMRETLRLRRLVKDLHMMAKAEAGAMQPQRRAVRLAPLVDEVFAALIPEFERVNVEPRNNVAYNLPVIWADPDMLSRVFDNLCSNALRYTPAGGYVSVEAAQQKDMLLIAVVDSGQGIPTGALPRIFDRFYRADPARQVTTGGSGLGLAIVRAIIEAHGGSVWAENMSNAGARINFTLPLASANWEQLAVEQTMPLALKSAALATNPSQQLKNPRTSGSLPEQEKTMPVLKRSPGI
ncbi:MAG TPA: ATP-binding protein [Ktedonobacteraceae bacterium]